MKLILITPSSNPLMSRNQFSLSSRFSWKALENPFKESLQYLSHSFPYWIISNLVKIDFLVKFGTPSLHRHKILFLDYLTVGLWRSVRLVASVSKTDPWPSLSKTVLHFISSPSKHGTWFQGLPIGDLSPPMEISIPSEGLVLSSVVRVFPISLIRFFHFLPYQWGRPS
jgi:hypothetical protein